MALSAEPRGGDPDLIRRPPPHVYFLVSAVFHYLGPAFAVLLFARVDVLGVAWLRIVSAAVVFAAWRRPWHVSRLLVAWGCVLAAMNCCFYLAIDRLPLGTVAAIEFLPVVLLAALGARTPRNGLALALAAPGVFLLTGVHVGGEGVALALAGANAVLFAAYIVLADRVAKQEAGLSGVDSLAASMLVAAVVVTPMAGWAAVPAFGDPVAILAGVGVGLCSSVIPYVADQLALARLPRATYALMVSLLPATATVIGIVVLTQVPSLQEVAGIALIVGGVALHRPAAPLQRKGTRMSRSSSSDGSPRPSRLLVVSQSASPDGSTATVRMRPNSPSSSDSGSPSLSPSTGMRQRR
jgi:inner membrane transporter RhtA